MAILPKAFLSLLEGERVTAAFLLKGPSKFHEMKITDLGKNGDQIVRLFQEPADFLILQHCHPVGTAVRHTMKAFAMSHQRRYVVIDGYDTLRILRAYEKI